MVSHRVVHGRVVERLVDQLYDRELINNVDRGVYVEFMIEIALRAFDEEWECMPGWSEWDLQHQQSKARIEVKQSTRLQPWSEGSPRPESESNFRICPTKRYDKKMRMYVGEPQRWADLYIFAYHPESVRAVADHRLPDQWEFYPVPEYKLLPLQKTIGINPVRSKGSPCSLETLAVEATRLAVEATRLIDELPRLKAESTPS